MGAEALLPYEKRRPFRPTSLLLAGGARTARAGKLGLVLTWRTVTLVFAPQEHPFPIGLGSGRAARFGEPIWVHATPVTEALHVPLHLERSCRAAPAQAD